MCHGFDYDFAIYYQQFVYPFHDGIVSFVCTLHSVNFIHAQLSRNDILTSHENEKQISVFFRSEHLEKQKKTNFIATTNNRSRPTQIACLRVERLPSNID